MESDSQIQQMEGHLGQLRQEHVELIAEGKSAQNLVDELRLKVEELEKEVDSQRVLISDGAEEKREVIRQLCFSLEHYRSWHKELRQAFIGHMQHAVLFFLSGLGCSNGLVSSQGLYFFFLYVL